MLTLTVTRGGGIDRARRAKIFNYMYSTAPKVDSGCFLSLSRGKILESCF